ncbi:MAG: PAS domain-containing protein [Desulfobacterota bacterium]|nr:PAS domain-containing protein [Thermodesulfobacteriota bacterium]
MTTDQAKTKAQLLAELQELRQRLKVLESSGPRPQSDKKRPPEKMNYGVLAEAANDFIFVIDRDDRVAYVNRYAAEQVGKPPEAIVGQPRERLFPPQIATSQQESLQKVFRTGQPLNVESKIAFGNREVWINTWLVPFQKQDNRVQSVLGISRDLTERRQIEEKLRALSARLQSVREEERATIAREIHDDLGQRLTGLKMDLSWLQKRLQPNQGELRQKTEAMSRLIDATVKSVRRLSTELRPRILDDFGLIAALEWQAQEFQNKTGIPCRFKSDLTEIRLPQDQSVAVFRIFQEALTNVARHARAGRVEALLRRNARGLTLTIKDNGRGISPDEMSRSKSLGLLGMRERALLFGWDLTLRGSPGRGTTVALRIPEI